MNPGLSISSPEFRDGTSIPSKFTADGQNINPPLEISGVSPETVSLALIIDDPDAATDPGGPGKTFDHWIVFNIDPKLRTLKRTAFPSELL